MVHLITGIRLSVYYDGENGNCVQRKKMQLGTKTLLVRECENDKVKKEGDIEILQGERAGIPT